VPPFFAIFEKVLFLNNLSDSEHMLYAWTLALAWVPKLRRAIKKVMKNTHHTKKKLY
jgi:hypothetical protein